MKLRGHLEDPVQDGRIIWNTDPKGIGCGWGLGSFGSGWKPVVGCYEYSTEALGSIKHGEFPDQLSNY